MQEFVFINGDADDLADEMSRVSTEIGCVTIDVAFVGIGEISNMYPASILQSHPNAFIFLDKDAVSKLTRNTST